MSDLEKLVKSNFVMNLVIATIATILLWITYTGLLVGIREDLINIFFLGIFFGLAYSILEVIFFNPFVTLAWIVTVAFLLSFIEEE